MLQSMPCFCSASQARMPSQVDAICAASQLSLSIRFLWKRQWRCLYCVCC